MRVSPNESATELPIGTYKIGNDGNIYKICLDKNKRHYWVKKADVLNKWYINFKVKLLYEENIRNKLIYCGILNVKDKLCFGDTVMSYLNDFKSGKYHIYYFGNSLIASFTKLTDASFSKKELNNIEGLCSTFDLGMHILRDSYNIKLLEQTENSIRKPKRTNNGFDNYSIIEESILGLKKNQNKKWFAIEKKDIDYPRMSNLYRFIKDIDAAKNIFNEQFMKSADNILGYMASNNYGDTTFDVLTNDDNTILFLVGYNEQLVIDKLLDVIQ